MQFCLMLRKGEALKPPLFICTFAHIREQRLLSLCLNVSFSFSYNAISALEILGLSNIGLTFKSAPERSEGLAWFVHCCSAQTMPKDL